LSWLIGAEFWFDELFFLQATTTKMSNARDNFFIILKIVLANLVQL
jgi:hypothetical protein